MVVFWWLHEPVDMEMFDWSTNGAKPLQGQPLGQSRRVGHRCLDSIWLKGVFVRAVWAHTGYCNQRLSGQCWQHYHRNFLLDFPSFTSSAWKAFVFCLRPEVLTEVRTALSTDRVNIPYTQKLSLLFALCLRYQLNQHCCNSSKGTEPIVLLPISLLFHPLLCLVPACCAAKLQCSEILSQVSLGNHRIWKIICVVVWGGRGGLSLKDSVLLACVVVDCFFNEYQGQHSLSFMEQCLEERTLDSKVVTALPLPPFIFHCGVEQYICGMLVTFF